MATLTKGKTFTSGETVTPTKLHELVDLGTVTNIVDADISASAAIAASKLASTLDLSSKTITLPDGNIGTSKIANSAVTAAKLDGAQTGSAPIYGCRAWVNFDGTKDTTGAASTANTNRLIRASGNVASVLRNAQGRYTITFTTAMPDADYATFSINGNNSQGGTSRYIDSGTAQTASAVTIETARFDGNGLVDAPIVSLAVVR